MCENMASSTKPEAYITYCIVKRVKLSYATTVRLLRKVREVKICDFWDTWVDIQTHRSVRWSQWFTPLSRAKWWMISETVDSQHISLQSICKQFHLSRRIVGHSPAISVFDILLIETLNALTKSIHRVTVTKYCSISLPAGFRRHLVGKPLRNVCYSAVT